MSSDDNGVNSPSPPPPHEGRGGLDPQLHDRLLNRMAAFGDALDIAAANTTADSVENLRQAADQLMRAVARLLIETDSPERSRRSPE